MKEKLAVNAIHTITSENFDSVVPVPPVFEVIEDFEVASTIYKDGTTVRVLLRRRLDFEHSRFASGPYWLDLRVGSNHVPHYGVSEVTAREAACRFLLTHVEGITPTLN